MNAYDPHIEVGNPYDVMLWSMVLGVSSEEIVTLASRVGTNTADIQAEHRRLIAQSIHAVPAEHLTSASIKVERLDNTR